MISYFSFNYIHLILIHCLSACFCNQHPVNFLLHCFLCIFIEMITNNIDCLPDFLCKCVPLCFCIHHFFHNHFFLSFWIPGRKSFHLSLSGHYSLNQAQNGHFQFRRLPIYSLFIFACKKPDFSTNISILGDRVLQFDSLIFCQFFHKKRATPFCQDATLYFMIPCFF